MSAPYKFYSIGHLCTKKYQSWWKFDEVLAKTILTVFRHGVCALYGNARIRKVKELRHVILQRKCGGDIAFKKSANFDLSALPPCLDCVE